MADRDLTVLIIGSGGREHALVDSCRHSSVAGKVIAAPGNGGMEKQVECRPLDVQDPEAAVALARTINADLVIVGPEIPLASGVADALRTAGIDVFGPGLSGARLESSKAFCKDFLERHRIPTASYARFTEIQPALDHLKSISYPTVVKASGLAAGKGVIICEDQNSAAEALRDMLENHVFGESGNEVIIEDFLEGEEASIMVLVSDGQYVCLPPSQDHKRIGEGDTGPNTGGMGAYAPANVVDDAMMRRIREEIIEPTIHGLLEDGIEYRGILFIGLMISSQGPRVLEFNVRFGDPECQVLLPLCETDPLKLMLDCARGALKPDEVNIRDASAMIVVLAAEGYPGSYPKGDIIELPESLPGGVHILHAGTQLNNEGEFVSSGGRVLGVVAVEDSLEGAAQKAYQVCDEISWEHKYFRRDIGWRQLKR